MSDEEDVVWSAEADHAWKIEVTRLSARAARFTVTNIETGEEIANDGVSLMYGALFGPDVTDVEMWGVMAIEAIDHYYKQHQTEKEQS